MSNMKLYQDLANVNFYKVDLISKTVIVEFSSDFCKHYSIFESQKTYSFKDIINLVHNDYKAKLLQYYHKLIDCENGTRFQMELSMKFTDSGDYCWINNIIQKESTTEYYGVLIDISDIKMTKDNYEMIVNNSTDLIVKYNLKGEIIYASPSYCKMFNINEKEVINKSYHEFDKYLSYNNDDWYQEILEPPYQSQKLICIKKENEENIWISWANNVIFKNGKKEYIISVGHDVTEIININQELEYRLNHDTLTELYNRRGIFHEIEKFDLSKKIVAFFIDLDSFKYINDFYGHATGDMILKEIGKILTGLEPYGCVVGRLSGDEFIVFLHDITNDDDINTVIEYLVKELNRTVSIGSLNLYVSCSIGYAIYPDDAQNIEMLISYSDIAMYDVKSSFTKRQCVRFNRSMYNKLKHHINVANDLIESIKSDGINVVYQEVIDCKDLSVKYLEVLARWVYQGHGNIPPDIFFNIAEKTGIAEELDFYIINKALHEFKQIKKMPKYKNSILSLNVMPTTVLNTNFPSKMQMFLKENNLLPKDVCIEINENTFVSTNKCIKQIAILKDLGFIIALDDFGSKFSSLAILDEIDYDIIKLDRQFIKKVTEKRLVSSILKMLREISLLDNKQVIIKGVENKELADLLLDIGFNLIQGFYYSIPKGLLN